MPDDVAEEKSKALEALGAKVEKVRPSSIVDKKQVCLVLFLVRSAASCSFGALFPVCSASSSIVVLRWITPHA